MASDKITYHRASTDQELAQILEIQKRNFKNKISTADQQKEGFVTVYHNFELLKKMNDACPHIIAKIENNVIGYALVMLKTFRNEIPVLMPMFAKIDELIPTKNYVVMGQVCIDKPFRQMGVFDGMYFFYQEELKDHFDCLFTEISAENKRSIAAHKRVGFKTLNTHISEGVLWELVIWNWP